MTKAQILRRFEEALDGLVDNARRELTLQGHKATGKLIQSIERQITSEDLAKLRAVILAEDYGQIVDKGVSPGEVPFSGTGGGGTSQYIEALLDWAAIVRPGLGERERKSFVFAVAYTQKRQGIPTSGSFSFSKNNRRTGWIKYGIEEYIPALENDLRLFDLVSRILDDKIQNAF